MIKTVRHKDENGRDCVGVELEGSFAELISELRACIVCFREVVVRSGDLDEDEYAYAAARLYGLMAAQREGCLEELNFIAENAEKKSTRRVMKNLIRSLKAYEKADPQKREKMMEKMLAEMGNELQDGKDDDKIKEMEDALKDRMEGKDLEP